MPGDKAMQLAALSLVVADGTFNKHLVTAKAIQYVVYSKKNKGGHWVMLLLTPAPRQQGQAAPACSRPTAHTSRLQRQKVLGKPRQELVRWLDPVTR